MCCRAKTDQLEERHCTSEEVLHKWCYGIGVHTEVKGWLWLQWGEMEVNSKIWKPFEEIQNANRDLCSSSFNLALAHRVWLHCAHLQTCMDEGERCAHKRDRFSQIKLLPLESIGKPSMLATFPAHNEIYRKVSPKLVVLVYPQTICCTPQTTVFMNYVIFRMLETSAYIVHWTYAERWMAFCGTAKTCNRMNRTHKTSRSNDINSLVNIKIYIIRSFTVHFRQLSHLFIAITRSGHNTSKSHLNNFPLYCHRRNYSPHPESGANHACCRLLMRFIHFTLHIFRECVRANEL